jgi:PAS domain S-box-containing protein
MSATILIIDDSADDQRLYQRAFKDYDCYFSLVMASSAQDGFARIAEASPDMVLLDYKLPDMDGLGFMKKLTEISDTPIPIVMLTGEASAAVAVEVMKHGADDYLVKDTEGRYLRLLPGVAGRVLASHAQRAQTQRLQQETGTLLRRNQALMKNSTDGIHMIDVEGNLLEANDAFCNMLGYTPAEAARLNVADWNAQLSAEELRECLGKLIGKSTMLETVHRRKDGSLVDVEVSTASVEIEGQHLFFAASRDITERKRAEEELKLSAQLLNSTTDSVFLIDFDGNFVYVNEAAWKSRGYTQDELMAINVSELTTPQFSKLVAPRIKELLENGHVIIESEHRCKDGSVMSVEVSSRIIESGGRKLILSSSRDITERKKTEAMMMQHKLVIDTSIDGFWVNDMLGNLREANEAYAKMSGYTVDELVHMHISQLEAKEQAADVKAHLAKIEAQGYDRFETRHRHKDGYEIDIEISATYMAEPPQLVVFCRDITERKRANLELQHNQFLLNEAQRLGQLGSWELDLISGVLHWSDEMYRIFELDPARFTHSYEGFLGVIHPDDRDKVSQAYTQSLQNHQPYDVEHRLLFADGRIKWVREHCTSTFDVSGKPLRSVGMTQDITERKQSEAALLLAEEKLSLESKSEHKRAEILAQQFGHLLQSSFNEIYLFDAESLHFLQVSEGAKNNLGYSDEELQQLTPLDLKTSFTRKKFGKLIAPLLSGERQTLLFETVHRRKDGTTYPVEARLQLIASEPAVYVAVVQDITERRRAENQLREFTAHLQNIREEEKARIAREIHDELGGTLIALKMDASWLAGKLSEQVKMPALQKCAKSMSGLLDNMVVATRRIITDLRPAILDDLGLMAAIRWQCAQFKQRTGIECRTIGCNNDNDCEDALDKMQSIHLFRIVQEALTNVARHSGASKVDVRLSRSDEGIVLMVYDNGRGLPEGHTVAPTSHGVRGMCERVKQLSGQIKFDSPLGGNFCITVTLPLPAGSKDKRPPAGTEAA